MATLNINTMNITTFNISTITGGSTFSGFTIIADGTTITDIATFVGSGGISVTEAGNTINIIGNATAGVNRIVAGGSTLDGTIIFVTGDYSTIGINGNSIIFPYAGFWVSTKNKFE